MTEILGPSERGEQPVNLQPGIDIIIPDKLNPKKARITLHASRPNVEFAFTLPPATPDEEINPLPATQRNIAQALRTRRTVRLGLTDQEEGDSVTIVYGGKPAKRFPSRICTISQTYKYTNELGWSEVSGSYSFNTKEGPNVQ